MTTMAMNNLWNYIQGLNLSRRNQAWLKERLQESMQQGQTEAKDSAQMTREEFFSRVDKASKGPIYACDSVEELDRLIRASV